MGVLRYKVNERNKMKITRYTLSVGLNNKDTLRPVDVYEHASIEVAGRLAQLGISCTITRGTGVYKHERGDVVIEETVVISIIDFDGTAGAKLGAFIDGVKRDYNQESVAVVTDSIEGELNRY